jgi:hypothetical protein
MLAKTQLFAGFLLLQAQGNPLPKRRKCELVVGLVVGGFPNAKMPSKPRRARRLSNRGHGPADSRKGPASRLPTTNREVVSLDAISQGFHSFC